MRYLVADARAGGSKGDAFSVAVLRAAEPWLHRWAYCFESTLRAAERCAMRKGGTPGARRPEATEQAPGAPADAAAYLRVLAAILRRALLIADTQWFCEFDNFGCARMTENLLIFLESVDAGPEEPSAPKG
ncbi:MAG: hypothetical protein ACE37J_20325 [Pikeienuella sp.]|uniref:hypothetical protein n=1 Tax=Pikeienuella sp. TaxID=2831957 RepID=UPI00391D7DD4